MDDLAPEKPEEALAIVPVPHEPNEIKKGLALPPLSAEEQKQANELAQSLIRSEDHLDDLVTFGSDAQDSAAQIAKDMLMGVRVGTVEDMLQMTDGVLAEIHTVDVADLLPSARRFLLFFKEGAEAIKQRIRDFFRRYELVNSRLDRQEAAIFSRITASTERYYRDKALAELTLKTWQEAQLKVTAIQMFLNAYGCKELDRRLTAVAAEKEAARAENRSVNHPLVVAADRLSKYIERLEMRKTQLYKLTISAYQMNSALRLMQDNENILRQKLNDIHTDLLPQWRIMIAIAYQAYQQQEIMKLVTELEEAEVALRYKTADQLEEIVQGMGDLMHSPVRAIIAMKYYQDKLIHSLDTLKTASIQAKKARDEAEAEMKRLLDDMGNAAAAIAERKE